MVMAENDLPIGRAIIETPDNDVLVVRRKFGRFAGKWELPGGRVNSREDPISGLVREVREETGISLDIEELIYLFGIGVIDERRKIPPIEPFPIIGQTVYLFQTRDLPSVVLGDEHDRFRFISAERFTDDARTPNKLTALTRSSLSYFFYGMRRYKPRENIFQEPPAVTNFDDYWKTAIKEWGRRR